MQCVHPPRSGSEHKLRTRHPIVARRLSSSVLSLVHESLYADRANVRSEFRRMTATRCRSGHGLLFHSMFLETRANILPFNHVPEC